jgi:hypothetical protein
MLPKKLFTPKCLHIDRDTVFKEDLNNFYRYCASKLKLELTSNNDLEGTIAKLILSCTFKDFKNFYKECRISMLHFSKIKEENSKEYYEVLFGVIQFFLIEEYLKPEDRIYNKLYKMFSIYTLFSIYYTQISDTFYQINTCPELLHEMNLFLNYLTKLANEDEQKKAQWEKNIRILSEMVIRLYKDDAFSIGVVPGLKTILLNKHCLPMEQKSNIYKNYVDINESYKKLELSMKEEKIKNSNLNSDISSYMEKKRDIINDIKSLSTNIEGFDSNLYCQFMNIANTENTKSYQHYAIMDLSEADLKTSNEVITQLDLQFNQIDQNS